MTHGARDLMRARLLAAPARAVDALRGRLVRFAAALLSLLFPGVGQAFTGCVGRGAAFAAAAAVWGVLYHVSPYGAVLAPTIAPFVLLLLAAGVALALGSATDAFRLARRGGHDARPRPLVRWLLYAAFAALPALPGLAAPLDWAHYSIPSGSMVPTLRVGDHVLAIEGYYRRFAPRRGDLVAFDSHGVLFIKRLVGLPGDRIEMRDGALFIDGAPAPLEPLEPLAARPPACAPGLYPRFLETLPGRSRHPILLDCGPGTLRDMAALEVPPGHYFMLGDNRDNSEDSRDPVSGVGLVPQEALVARAVFVAYSLDWAKRWLGLPFAVRWARTGSSLE